MAEKIKKNWDIALVLSLGLILSAAGLMGLNGMISQKVLAASATETVSVTATVQAWMTFTANPTSTTLDPNLVDTSGGLHVGSSTNVALGVGTNAISGWNVTIQGKYGGLCHQSATGTACGTTTENLITSIALGASTTLSTTLPGSDGYGANATPTLSGVTVTSYYNGWGTDTVGGIASSTSQTLIQKGTPNASTSVANLKIKSTADQAQKSGNYYDTVTLTATTVP